MKITILSTLCAFFMVALVSCGNKTAEPVPAEDSIVSEEPEASTIDTQALINQRVKELGKKYLIIKQPNKGRIIYIKGSYHEDWVAKLYVEDVVNGTKESISFDVNENILELTEGRNEDEIFVFSAGGEDCVGMITHVKLKPLRVLDDFDSLDLCLDEMEVEKKTSRGFLIRTAQRDDDDLTTFIEQEAEIDFDGNVIWKSEPKTIHYD